MNNSTIDDAVKEAKRFLKCAQEFKHAEKEKRYSYQSFPKESGAMRRSSLDLTRSLANLRKPG